MIIQTTKPLKRRAHADFYPTPIALARASLNMLPAGWTPEYVLDPSAGLGVYGQAVKDRYPAAVLAGMDLRGVTGMRAAYLGARDGYALPRLPEYDFWQPGRDFLRSTGAPVFDLIITNPPYNVAEEFVRKALDWLTPGGWLVYLLRLAFLEGQDRYEGLWADAPPMIVTPLVERPSFTGDDLTDATAYANFYWQKGVRPAGDRPAIEWLSWKPRRHKRRAADGARQMAFALEGV